MAEKTVGILTGGGDCPGLNAVIRAAVRKGITQYDYRFKGIQKGWKGMMECDWEPLGLEEISGILPKGGTILGTSRTNPFKEGDGGDIVAENMRRMKLDALIAIGGEDTLGVASKLNDLDVPVVGVPKTIDNDLNGTDYTFGFDTAVNIVTEAIDRIHTTAESHNRVMVIEVMGRHSGWIALHAGLAGGADMILIPEQKYTVDEIVQTIEKRHNRGKDFSIVVVAEGVMLQAEEKDDEFVVQEAGLDEFGHVKLGGIGQVICNEVEQRTGFETRVTVLGHLQRGGTPTAFDRVLGTRFGIAAIDLVHAENFGNMVSLQGNEIVSIPLSEAVDKLKVVDQDFYDLARVFFG
ncbi:MAG: ATP-dependent 6-phosphofructokinase [Candidatus Latescibacterota bacterium]|nr:ATP-dependent 6-phosphofructokinase [Candidatus Latescibacterota bacterium]MEC8646297.1 ATP-dependent 6-phosphofructokinase [Candidatus Latescibacterota bacterium]MEE2627129.1 ATP-dependent 6-phosphofructokinase [Candidatus Latescibacterota bacterium]MEE2727629.1 ATP-dependent 6-phosphofructokinase [Candidatus Latescibacterota bacterium]